MPEETKLLAGLKAGRLSSLEKAVKQYTPYVNVVIYNAARGALCREDVEEIAADSFVQLWRSADKLDESRGTLKAYLAAVTRNLTLNHLRGQKPAQEIPFDLPSPNALPEDALIAGENYDRLYSEIMALGEPDNEIFLRFYCYDEKIKRIAAAMDMPAATVKTKLRRGRAKLAERLKAKEILCERNLKGGMADD